MAGNFLRSQDVILKEEHANLGGQSASSSTATDAFKKRWDAARGLAAQLQSRGVHAGHVYILLTALLPTGWDSDAGICLSGDAAAWLLREMSLLCSALFTTLSMYDVVEARLNGAMAWKSTTMALFSQGQGPGQTNVLKNSQCHLRPRRHIGQQAGVQPSSENAQCSAQEGGAMPKQFHARPGCPRDQGSFGIREPASRATKSPYSRP